MLVTVTGDFGLADGAPAQGTVRFAPYLVATHTTPPVIVTRATVAVELDAAGAFTVDLLASDDPGWLTTEPVPYLVRWSVTGSYAEKVVLIPAGGPWDLTQLVDLDEPPAITPTPTPGPQGEKGDKGDTGATGPQGAKGDKGDPGPVGPIVAANITDSTPSGRAVLTGDADTGVAALGAAPWPYRFGRRSVIDKALCSTNIDLLKDQTVFMPFRADAPMVVTGMAMASNSATTGATSIRFALYHYGYTPIISPQSMRAYVLARTDNDVTMFAGVDTLYTRAWSATGGYPTAVRLVPGEWYAAAYTIIGGTMGRVVGPPAFRFTIAGSAPNMSAAVTSAAINPPPATLYGQVSGSSMPGQYNGGYWADLVLDPASTKAAPQRAATCGDSFPSTYPGWLAWGNAQAGAPIYLRETYGVGGSTVDQVPAQLAAHVTLHNPRVVIVHSGTNDIALGVSTATMQARYTAVLDAVQAIPSVTTVVLCTPPPSTTITGAKITVLSEVRAWMLALTRPGVMVADTGMAMSTGDGVTSDPAKRQDGVHPNLVGDQAMADMLDDVLRALPA